MSNSNPIGSLAFAASLATLALALCWPGPLSARDADQRPTVGDVAADFNLATLDGGKVQLARLQKEGPVVLLVLRGFPGYQCPVCNAQVGQYLGAAQKLKAAGANVVLVYPGMADGLREHANEFVRGKTLPANFYFALDPDFTFTKAYNLRWEAKNETAYPATFVIAAGGKISFAKISMTHGDRAGVDEVLKALAMK